MDAVVDIYLTDTATKPVASATIHVVDVPFKLVFFKTDHLGTVRAVTDQDGKVLSTHDYLAYGEEITDPEFTTNRMKFTGHERDPETNLDYMKARYYTAGSGRFLQVDPGYDYDQTDPMSFNLYGYVRANPVMGMDPTGKDAIFIAFPDYKIHVGNIRIPHLGHAGVLLIDNKTGHTEYYEYGRYDRKEKGVVVRRKIPDVKINTKTGMPTKKSLERTLTSISKQSGKGGRIEGAYVKNDKFDEMRGYAQNRMSQNNNPNRETYKIFSNNCATFALDTIKAGGENVPALPVLLPTPNVAAVEMQIKFTPIKFNLDEGLIKFDNSAK